MNADKLNKWADLLLDTGKRNNLIAFRDSKSSSVEVIMPDVETLFGRVDQSARFEVFDPREELSEANDPNEERDEKESRLTKTEYAERYGSRVKKSQILLYNRVGNPLIAIKNIGKKSKTAIEETGVNIAYMAFGFIHWTERENFDNVFRAPILLVPVLIENESTVDPFYIRIEDDEIMPNPTFAFKLQNEYGIKLPEYEDEGLLSYFEKIRVLLSKMKWKVSSECKIGIFSFLKINMYEDLKDNAEVILSNRCVRALLGDPSEEEGIEDERSNDPVELSNVVDADSSQTEAIEAARDGKSFVLQGPPGTGKSQTITNIIAECLSCGKKVLFVSEKSAALNVVYDKLKRAGLEEFCLELHSHKANKKEVIRELCRTLRLPKTQVAESARREVESKRSARKDLDEYAAELHKVRPDIRRSLYDLYEDLSACRNAPDVDFVIKDLADKGADFIERAEISLSHYTDYARSIGYDYRKNAWFGYAHSDPSYEEVVKLRDSLEKTIKLLEEAEALNALVKKEYSLRVSDAETFRSIAPLFDALACNQTLTPHLLNKDVFFDAFAKAERMSELFSSLVSLRRKLDRSFDGDIYKLNGADLHKKLTKRFGGFFSRLTSGEYKRLIADIRLCAKEPKRLKYKSAVEAMDDLCVYQNKMQRFLVLDREVSPLFGSTYRKFKTDFHKLLAEAKEIGSLHDLSLDFGVLPNLTAEAFKANIQAFGQIAQRASETLAKFGQAEQDMVSRFDLEEFDVRKTDISLLKEKYTRCLASLDRLDEWCGFAALLKDLSECDLRAFVDRAIEQNVPIECVVSSYKKRFYAQWVDLVLRDSPTLIRLSRVPHDALVNKFAQKDRLDFEINKARIKAQLSASRPNLDMVAQGSAIATLLREGEKKRKQKNIRILLREIGELVQTLKPCFLMSPLSVSTFLSPEMHFDVVVFDEASQIFPQDAIGAIYRGSQLIVVGDSKQMPPSNFFNSMSAQEEDDEEEDITDFESVLDICATAFPQKRLKWHYRSRFEQLISFSNKNYYENTLVTFPSSQADKEGVGVDFRYVDGVFDRQSKTNATEAQKVVDLVFEHFEKYPERSLGVVAFSISQQDLIDKLIAKRRREDPSKEAFFRSDRPEPFFVKNLETVQGDERDTILFSVAYAKDAQGRFLLNFGPINREGGERRLNVAVTRAKYNVVLVSSIRCSDIDLSRTNSVGARLLREYLDYAENGSVALERASANPFERSNSAFEEEVYEFLCENGFTVDRQVGRSAFRVDLALKFSRSSDYFFAIECDGESYLASESARDRDRLRQEILEGMGWTFYRVWSTDWFRNKPVEKERLLAAARSAAQRKSENKKGGDSSREAVSFEVIRKVLPFAFPKYRALDASSIARRHRYDILATLSEIVKTESPLSEDWALKRLVFLYGKEKVTAPVKRDFQTRLLTSERFGILRKNGFLYLSGAEIPMLRVPDPKNGIVREIKDIAPEELARGMKQIVKENVTVEKSGLFRLLVQQLGFSRIGDAMQEHLESALALLRDEVVVKDGIVTLH